MQEPVLTDPTDRLFAPGACIEMTDEAEKAGVPEPPADLRPMPKDLTVRELAASDQMTEAAERHGVMWARVKGFPHWPVCARCIMLVPSDPPQH